MAFTDIRKQLQKEFAIHSQQALRLQGALRALDGASTNGVTEIPRKKFKMSAAARRRISVGIRKAKLARAEKQKK